MKPKPFTLTPRGSAPSRLTAMGAATPTSLVVAYGGLRFFDEHGALVKTLAVDSDASSDHIVVHGDLVAAWHRHGSTPYVIGNQARETVRAIKKLDLSLPKISPAWPGRLFVHDMEKVMLLGDEGEELLRVEHGKRENIRTIGVWDDRMLVDVFDNDADESSHVLCIEKDGKESWRVPGRASVPRGDHVLVDHDREILAVSREGQIIGRIANVGARDGHKSDGVFTFDGDDVLVSTDNRVVRCHPKSSRVLWSTPLAVSSLKRPVCAGRVVAAAPSPYADERTVFFLDAQTGHLLHSENAAGKVTDLCAVDQDAFVACSYTKKIVGWRFAGAMPQRLTLEHDAKVFDVAPFGTSSLAAHTGDAIVFWRV
jgi:hypothetical protein